MVAFLGGILGQSIANFGSTFWLIILAVSLAGLGLFYNKILAKKLSLISFCIFFALGGLWLHRAQSVVSQFPAEGLSEVELIGYVASEPKFSGRTQDFTFQPIARKQGDGFFEFREKILVQADLFPVYRWGDFMQLKTDLGPSENFSDFDYVAFLARQGIFQISKSPKIFPLSNLELNLFENFKVKLLNRIFLVKAKFEASVQQVVVEPNAAFINGILLGTRSKIPEALINNFAQTGLTHILAISGYNITIIAWVFLASFLIFSRRQVAVLFSLIGIILFVILTGASASVVRAGIMGGLILLATSVGRQYDYKISLALAGAFMAFQNPYILRFDIGFQLSFLATVGILYFSPIVQERLIWLPERFRFRETAAMTISAQILVLPLILHYFNFFSVVALPANLLVLPLIPSSMLFGFLAGIAGLIFYPLGLVLGWLAWLVTSLEIAIIRLLAALPFSGLELSFPWPLVALAYGLIFFWFWRFQINTEKPKLISYE